MNYDKYYKLCQEAYKNSEANKLAKLFYQEPVQIYKSTFFGSDYIDTVDKLSIKVECHFLNFM